MARIRTIKPEFWDDLKVAKISRDARLLYIGMWNFADDLGVIIGDSLWIKSKVFPFDQIQIQQFDKWIQELVKSGFISQFSHKGEDFYYLPNLTRHQVINRPNLDKVNVKQSDLSVIVDSLINHGTFNDDSYSGKEGKGKGKERKGDVVCDPKNENQKNDFDLVMELFNKTCVSLPKINKLSETRKKKVSLRLAEMGQYEKWEVTLKTVFEKSEKSEFLRGENKNGWRATFDWIFENETNWVKIFEGNFDNKQTKNDTNKQNSRIFVAQCDYGESTI